MSVYWGYEEREGEEKLVVYSTEKVFSLFLYMLDMMI